MADIGSVWRTEYVAAGAMISEEQFEELAEIASRLRRVASMSLSGPATLRGSSIAELYSWALRGTLS